MEYRFEITCWVTLKTGERCRIASGETINGDLLETGNLASCLQQQYCKEVPAPVLAPIAKTPEVEPPAKATPTTQATPKAATTPKKN